MIKCIGIIRETKNEWERRAPLIPADVKSLISELPVRFVVQPSDLRIFREEEYLSHGASIKDELSTCEMIIGIKEIKIRDLLPRKIYLFFSHTIKGQSYNMPMLRKILELQASLIDYERMINDQGQRLIYFSYHAGLAGIVDTLWAYGKKMALEGMETPFSKISHSLQHPDLSHTRAALQEVGAEIKINGLPPAISPFVVGITGYGNVSHGVQHLLDILPVTSIEPEELAGIRKSKPVNRHTIYKTVFREEHMVQSMEGETFDLQHYYKNPDKYRSRFEPYLDHLNILVNASFWNNQYPHHVTRQFIRELYAREKNPRLRVIGDISCDVKGGVECTLKTTTPGNPVFVYLPEKDEAQDGFEGHGPVIMAVDNLPSEIPAESSTYFSSVLRKLVPDLVKADYGKEFNELNLPSSLKKAIVVYHGELTPDYQYLKQYLDH